MSTPSNPTPSLLLPALCAGGALLLAGCAASPHPERPNKLHDAAAYNVQLGIAYMNQGDLQQAKDKLDRAATEDPGSADVHSARAMLFERMADPSKADGEWRSALRIAPHDPNIVNNYAVYLCQNGRTDEGVKRFTEAARDPLYKTPWAAYSNAGVCLLTAKRNDEARADFERALQIRPNFAEAAFQLAGLEFQQGQLAPARARIDGFLGTFEETPDLLLLGVRVARAQGDRIAAQRYARKLQLDFPGSDQTRALAQLDHNPG
jgi:type IV pilus assembly protein PilF